METAEYQRLHDFETSYWWYVAQRENLIDAVEQLQLAPGARVLDAGCGTGRNLTELSRRLSLSAFGFDVSPCAAAFWNGVPDVRRCLASINELPYSDESFDAVCSVDVLGCEGVQIGNAVAELTRVLRQGGHLILLVPAYQWLRSPHDAAVHSVHRFSRGELRGLAGDAGLTVVRLTHRFTLFFPLIAGVRIISRIGGRSSANGQSDLVQLPAWLNGILARLARAEHKLAARASVPFGTTILLVARKNVA
jgi:SAM-dependent methyltransferase